MSDVPSSHDDVPGVADPRVKAAPRRYAIVALAIGLVCLSACGWWLRAQRPAGGSAPAVVATGPTGGQTKKISSRGAEFDGDSRDLAISIVADRPDLRPLQRFRQTRIWYCMGMPERRKVDLPSIGPGATIKGIKLTNLEIETLAPLGSLENLRALDLIGCVVHDWQSLRHLSRLEWLGIYGCESVNLNGLSGLQQLEFLLLRSARVTDFAPLYGHPALRHMIVDWGEVRVSPDDVTTLKKSKSSLLIMPWDYD